jgi:hypothetical protein
MEYSNNALAIKGFLNGGRVIDAGANADSVYTKIAGTV